MSSSNAPLFTNNRPLSATTDGEETALLGDTTLSPSRPLVASLLPTLYTRGLALPLATLTLLLFASHAPTFAGAIVFLSFAIARQLYVFAWYFANKIVVIHVKVTDERFKSLLEGEQGAWYQKFVALLVDGVILFGLLLTLTVVARKVAIGYYEDEWQTLATTGVVLGFVTFGLLLISAPDFGYPGSVNLVTAIERPASGLIKFATSVTFGVPEDEEESTSAPLHAGKTVQNNVDVHEEV